MKHTPGPWTYRKKLHALHGNSDLFEIHWSSEGECTAEIVHGEANARLIAAAPEMLNLLKELEEWFRDCSSDPTYANQIAEIVEGIES